MEDIYSQSLSVGVPLNHSIDQPASFHRGKRRCFVHEARGATGLLAEQVLLNVALHINAYTKSDRIRVYIFQSSIEYAMFDLVYLVPIL